MSPGAIRTDRPDVGDDDDDNDDDDDDDDAAAAAATGALAAVVFRWSVEGTEP
jgi:hypothetical protein